MKITRRQLRRIIGETIKKFDPIMSEGNNIYIWEKPWIGMWVEDENGKFIPAGEMIATLLDAGDDDIFDAPQGVDERSLQKMINKWAELDANPDGQNITAWDNDVFETYYNVDLSRVIRLYARRMNLNIIEKEPEALPQQELSPEEEEAARTEFELESFYS